MQFLDRESAVRRTILTISVVVGMMGGWTDRARASDWSCEVLLCLSNPGGATQFPRCVAPIIKLWSDLARGKAFPTCSGGGVVEAKVYNKDVPSRRYVAMSFSDGTRKTYSLADIETVGAGRTGGQEQ